MQRAPAYTGPLSVTYRAPTSIDKVVELRARPRKRDGRTLLIRGRAALGGTTIAEADGPFITADLDRFTAGHRLDT